MSRCVILDYSKDFTDIAVHNVKWHLSCHVMSVEVFFVVAFDFEQF